MERALTSISPSEQLKLDQVHTHIELHVVILRGR